MLRLTNISKNYRKGKRIFPVLKDVNLEIRPSEMVALMGRSGSGKTTLINIIAGLLAFHAGTYTFGKTSVKGLDSHGLDALREKISE